ncbi:FecR family protein [Chitinophaga pinensis]|uniref:Anti-FecI sigma factor, FecR n=1 Tax=Chitinophaga pinensis (strain ATCC 43595 / DSM 2588 / LMG 13176 / NBRC 15968 / NCIMB 11800 / UQM 2034) TaxID=485918 RepID=A0A979GWQ1_CHIPD|nr:FecR family protein [Chitinophaga pinensis]ACU60665.1 anti-FecI sigma factor, FecR [Chitinophaga pinensis DSM 2588]
MSPDRYLIEQLVLKELSGVITDSEKAMLDEAVRQDPAMWALKEELKRELANDEIRAYLANHPADEKAPQILDQIYKREKRQKTILRLSTAIAASGLIAFAAIKYLLPESTLHKNNTAISQVNHTDTSVLLRLPDGKEILLDSATKQLNTANINISTASKALSYEAMSEDNGALAVLQVPDGKDYKIHLNDGSEVHLNAGTRLEFPLKFSEESRDISINGEAYIKVAKQASKPFIVHLPHGTVQVLGTEFNVNTYDSGVHKVALVEGSVAVKAGNKKQLLKPGFELTSDAAGLKTSDFDAEEVLSWREGKYFINNLNFLEISRVLSRCYGVTVSIDNERVAKQYFTGVIYKNQSIDIALRGMQLTNTIEYYTDKAGVIHIK